MGLVPARDPIDVTILAATSVNRRHPTMQVGDPETLLATVARPAVEAFGQDIGEDRRKGDQQ
jgi:hypothetical protein